MIMTIIIIKYIVMNVTRAWQQCTNSPLSQVETLFQLLTYFHVKLCLLVPYDFVMSKVLRKNNTNRCFKYFSIRIARKHTILYEIVFIVTLQFAVLVDSWTTVCSFILCLSDVSSNKLKLMATQSFCILFAVAA